MDKPTILLVDDEIENVNAWAIHFTTSKYNIKTATSGEEALQIAETLRLKSTNIVLVVIIDVIMAGIDGVQVLDRLKGIFPFAKIYIVTENVSEEEMPTKAFLTGRYGGSGFYRKATLRWDKLLKTIDSDIKDQSLQLEKLGEIL